MSKTEYRLEELNKDNILSFDEYLPQNAAIRILDEGVFGWGVVEADYASGVILCERNRETDVLWILWLYVDEEVRNRGIADRLYEEALKAAGEVRGVNCQYLFPAHEAMEEYLLHKGFSIYTKREGDPEEDEEEVHLARLMLQDPISDDGHILSAAPRAAYQLPRLFILKEYLDELEIPSEIVAPEGFDPGICVERMDPLAPIDIYVLPDLEDQENYSIAFRIALDLEDTDFSTAEEAVKNYAKDFVITEAELDPEEETLEFVAMLPVDSGVPDKQIFSDFLAAYIKETDGFLENVY